MNHKTHLWTVLSAILALGISHSIDAKVIYVDATAVGANNGTSWQNAHKTLRNALTAAAAGDEVRVAQGTYRPDQGTGITAGSRVATFQIKTGAAVKGGYAGLGQADPNARDVTLFETILSGDLKADDAVVADPCQLWTDPTRSDNAYNVVTLANADPSTLLDGLTITAGLESRSGNPRGDGGPGGGGGAVVSIGNPSLIQCTFRGNAGRSGGGLLITTGTPTLTDCRIIYNYAFTDGGAINFKAGSMKLQRCILAGNTASGNGGGIKVSTTSSADKVELTHCVLTGNKALAGSALDYPALVSYIPVTMAHSILWNNTDTGTSSDLSMTGMLHFCCVQQGLMYHDGGGNISADPLFVRAGSWDSTGHWIDGDYHLMSQAGRWNPADNAWVQDLNTSPCIDAGNPDDPIGPEPFPNGGIVNMGLYGGTAEASKSYFDKPPCDTVVAGDVNGDCKVDAQDLAIMAFHWLEEHKEKVQIKWLGHAAFKVWTSSVVIYIDPYQITDTPRDATYILCSHTHSDHYSTSDIAKVAGPAMQLIGPPSVISSYGKGLTVGQGQTLTLGNLTITGVPAYNTNKSNHPKSNNWVGFVVELAGKRIYHAGDTDLIEEMKSLKDIDVAMLPVGATYTMNPTEAATATAWIQPKLAIPMHWNNTTKDTLAKTFAPNAACPVKIMTVGEIIGL